MLGQKHGPWHPDEMMKELIQDGHDEAEGSLRGSYTQRLNFYFMAEDIYEVYLLGEGTRAKSTSCGQFGSS